jgi:hypothetical protein
MVSTDTGEPGLASKSSTEQPVACATCGGLASGEKIKNANNNPPIKITARKIDWSFMINTFLEVIQNSKR